MRWFRGFIQYILIAEQIIKECINRSYLFITYMGGLINSIKYDP